MLVYNDLADGEGGGGMEEVRKRNAFDDVRRFEWAEVSSCGQKWQEEPLVGRRLSYQAVK